MPLILIFYGTYYIVFIYSYLWTFFRSFLLVFQLESRDPDLLIFVFPSVPNIVPYTIGFLIKS